MGNDNSRPPPPPPDGGLSALARPGGLEPLRNFSVTVQVGDSTYAVPVPDRYKTNGWLLREASQRHVAAGEALAEGSQLLLRALDGRFLDLGAFVAASLSHGDVVEAVQHGDGAWDAASVAVSRPAADILGGRAAAHTFAGVGVADVTVCIGHGCEYVVSVPGREFTVGWVLSEAIRRYMIDNDEQDPGVLGLRSTLGEDLDLSDFVVDVLADGDAVDAVSYTVKRSRRSQALAERHREELRLRAARNRARSASARARRVELDGRGMSAAAAASAAAASHPDDDSDEDDDGGDGQDGDPWLRRTGSGNFLPLRDLLRGIEQAEQRERALRQTLRFRDHGRPGSVVSFSAECRADPSGALTSYVMLCIDTLRLSVLDQGTQDLLVSWRYEDIQGWVVAQDGLTVKLNDKLLGLQKFEFATDRAAAISKALLKRVNQLIANRRHQKHQALLQRQREAALAYRRGLGDQDDDDDTDPGGDEAADADAEAEHAVEVDAERQIDPSDSLVRHLVLRFKRRSFEVLDQATRDVLFDWPYIMVYAWGVTERTFVVAVSIEPPGGRPDTKKAYYNTYAFRTAAGDDDRIHALFRDALAQLKEDGEPDAEVVIAKRMDSQRIRDTLQEEWQRERTQFGSCYQSTAPGADGEQVFTFENTPTAVFDGDEQPSGFGWGTVAPPDVAAAWDASEA